MTALLFGSLLFAERQIIIAALGDSTTAGTPFEKDPEGPYTAWLAKRHPEWDVRNYGVAGETTDQIRARFDTLLAEGPRYMIILGGANDIRQGLPLENTAKNLLYMYRRAKGKFVIPIAASVLPFDHASPIQNKQIRDLNRWIKKMTDKDRILFVDLHAIAAHPEAPEKLNGTPDGFHPDLGVQRAMGLELLKVIEAMEQALPH